MWGYFEPTSPTYTTEHDVFQVLLLAFLHLLSIPLYRPLTDWPSEGIPPCFSLSPLTMAECLSLSMSSFSPFTKLLYVPPVFFVQILYLSWFIRAGEHGIFLLQWKSSGQTDSDSIILNSITIFKKMLYCKFCMKWYILHMLQILLSTD